MKKKLTAIIATVLLLVIMFISLHSTPSTALRTHLFMTGHPIAALTTGIVDDEFHNRVDKQLLESQNSKCYTLTKPAFERPTQSRLRNYKVTKRVFLYFAEYYGEG